MRHLARIMRAIDKEPPCAHRRQTFLGKLDPVLVGQGFDPDLAPRQPRQKRGIGFFRIQSFHYGAGPERLLHDQDAAWGARN